MTSLQKMCLMNVLQRAPEQQGALLTTSPLYLGMETRGAASHRGYSGEHSAGVFDIKQ